MQFSVIVEFSKHIDRDYKYDDEGDLTAGFEDEDFTEDEIEDNKPEFEFPGLDYTQFDDGMGSGYGSYDWSGVLDSKAMRKLMKKLCLEVTDEQSMGTIGAPGCGWGNVPNIICRGCETDSGWVEAFVTPIPSEREVKRISWEGAKKKLAAMAA